ncbi:autotransporter assembly complex protein TamA [Rhizobiaceae bacterium BDR2-2]|uniref:Autotransporter assembly complex protein TamA n=1 Tax=Ectorhizobium quercum TaxID=2965071 RepID=A0AAE3MXT3_9HYPH|nr:autotransporter assembly complex family protein [Ectorhizobium quercum]MCX8996934.1 autotransporter assembly complex protein TamA [Ectorhizobium quercum]
MLKRGTRPVLSNAYSRAGLIGTLAGAVFLAPALARPVQAFELFGIHLFGKREEAVVVSDPVHYELTLEAPGAESDLLETLQNASELYNGREDPVSGDLGVVVKARDDRERLIAALYENARYGGVVRVSVAGQDIDSLPPNPTFPRNRPVPVRVTVEPGPVFRLGHIHLEGEAAGRNPVDLGLEPGGEAGSLRILRAGERLVAAFRNEGRPLARLDRREVVADHATQTVDVTLAATGGPVAPVGSVTVTGTEKVDSGFVRDYSRLNAGQPFSPEDMKKAADRLRNLSVFSSVTIKEANALAPDGTIPVSIEVAEGKHRYFGFGAQMSTTDGAGLSGYWGHRNLFGKAETLKFEGSVSRLGETTDVTGLDYLAGVTFSKPGIFVPEARLDASIIAKTEHPDTYEANSITAATSITYELNDRDTVSGGGEIDWSKTTDAFGENEYLTVSLPVTAKRDARDNKLDPANGYTVSLAAKPSYEINGGTFFSSVEGTVTGYKGLGENNRVVLAGKGALGTLIGTDDLAKIPTTRRFFAGGGGSVRGYSYQEISPYNDAGDATGGRSYALASAEVRIKVTETIGVVPFIDAGTVSTEMVPDFSDIRAGAGLGVRYSTPFGPLRLDVAVPLNKYDNGTKYGIYAGIGQAF